MPLFISWSILQCHVEWGGDSAQTGQGQAASLTLFGEEQTRPTSDESYDDEMRFQTKSFIYYNIYFIGKK